MAVDVVVEEVADNLEELARATRRINTNSVGFFVGGMVVGAAVGFYFGYKFNKEKIKAEAFEESEKEVEKIRELYQQRSVVAIPKPSPETIVEIQGYNGPVGSPLHSDALTVSGWNYAVEFLERSEAEPYVIHQDEYVQQEKGYTQVTYTYFSEDDTLVDESNNHPLPHADLIVGLNNLKFGHGTDDPDVVFVRNDSRELEMEICRVQKSYEEEVMGLNDDDDDADSS